MTLTERITAALEWYTGCDICPETLANVRKDLASLLPKGSPILLTAKFEDGYIVVSAIDRKLS